MPSLYTNMLFGACEFVIWIVQKKYEIGHLQHLAAVLAQYTGHAVNLDFSKQYSSRFLIVTHDYLSCVRFLHKTVTLFYFWEFNAVMLLYHLKKENSQIYKTIKFLASHKEHVVSIPFYVLDLCRLKDWLVVLVVDVCLQILVEPLVWGCLHFQSSFPVLILSQTCENRRKS